MLHTGRLMILNSQEIAIVPGQTVNAEGLPLVREIVNGQECVRQGNTTVAPFVGFSYTESLTPLTKSAVEVLTANSETGKLILKNEPLTGQFSVYLATSGAAIECTVSGKEVTVPEANKGMAVRVQYRYAPSTTEVLMEDRVLIPTMSSTDMLGSIGVIMEGIVYTDQFDAKANFADTSMSLCVTATGLVGMQASNGTLAAIPGSVVSVPGVDTPFLGIRI